MTAGSAKQYRSCSESSQNEGELDYFRGDALEALYQIDPEMGRRLAASFDHRTDYLGQSAGEVLVRAPRLAERRSVWDILRDRWLPQQYE